MDRVKKMVHYWCDDIKKAGLTGKGVTVAVLDTGLAPHPDFKSRVVGWRDCIYSCLLYTSRVQPASHPPDERGEQEEGREDQRAAGIYFKV